ncbi:HAMP domain-containing sensor histidine kinase [Halalkalibacter okhensis]|uniref:HAMP domain-containing sensor histidine kinase n=1 Tax=Halalkalibacter okhensis TaxID=333138 RepID=UPI000690F3C5|nr:HAMP domain-containing sensor histidine kinase [Halalkalibacter okhensis]
MIKTKKIFTKLFLSYALIIIISFLLFGLVFLWLFHLNLYTEFEETYVHHYEQVTSHFEAIERFQWNEEEAAASLQPSLSQKNFSIYIFNSLGEKVYTPHQPVIQENHINLEWIQAAAQGEMVANGGWTDGVLGYFIASPLIDHHDNQLVMVMAFHDLDHEYKQVVFMIFLTFAIIMAVAGIFLWFMSKKITAPLQEMNHSALRFAKGDFTQSVDVKTHDEIGQLGKTFNYMATELNNLEETRKTFIANVSHDLRSPLTSIKGFLIALLDGTIPEKRREHYYLLMKDETERMIKLVNDTLDMTRFEAGQVKIVQTPYNVTKQLQMLAVKLEPHLAAKEMEIQIIPDHQEIIVVADQDKIEQALINLVQNAIQVSPIRSTITIFLEKQANHVQIKIQDQGDGIQEEQLEHIWKRFYKTDKARTNKSGVGIGLAIVKSIMDLHDTDITVKSNPGNGTTFAFSLPLKSKQ